MFTGGVFDLSKRLESLSRFGDPLERLNEVINFEVFRSALEEGLNFSPRLSGGRPPYDSVLMFRILVLQSLYALSDDQTEYQIRDRLSFMRFLGLSLSQSVPDARTIWLYRERFKKTGLMTRLLALFNDQLKGAGYLAMGGQIVDASIIRAPRQRMTKEEKAIVKAGQIPESWEKHPAKLAQKDRDARWVVKYSRAKGEGGAVDISIPFFGYKTHLSIDRRYGFIRRSHVTDASSYDGKSLKKILDDQNTCASLWGDTAYLNKDNQKLLAERGMRNLLHQKKSRNKPMLWRTQKSNATKSRIRARVEHVFAAQKERMKLFIRTIGIKRAEVKIQMANLAYNFQRLAFWEKRLATTP